MYVFRTTCSVILILHENGFDLRIDMVLVISFADHLANKTVFGIK